MQLVDFDGVESACNCMIILKKNCFGNTIVTDSVNRYLRIRERRILDNKRKLLNIEEN